jgi:hypothetical protein
MGKGNLFDPAPPEDVELPSDEPVACWRRKQWKRKRSAGSASPSIADVLVRCREPPQWADSVEKAPDVLGLAHHSSICGQYSVLRVPSVRRHRMASSVASNH